MTWHVAGAPAQLGGGLLVVLLAVVAGRPDLAVLGVPLVLMAAQELLTAGPTSPLRARIEPGGDSWTARLELDLPARVGWVRARVSRRSHTPREVVLAARPALVVRARSVRTGPQELLSADVQGIGLGGAGTTEVLRVPAREVAVPPQARRVAAVPVPRRLRGHTGQHESRRPGEGGGLRDLAPFGAGDTVRRVDWKTTARQSPDLDRLWVRRTFGLAEAHVVVILDSRDDVGPDPRTWSGTLPVRPDDATSLDLARQAADSLTRAYTDVGDRIGVEDLGSLRHPMRAGTGRRHAERVRQWLAVVRPRGAPRRVARPPKIPQGALVVVVSTFLDSEAGDLALRWRRAGHRVLAVDVLPPVRSAHLSTRERLAVRLVVLEREDRLASLDAADVELVRWADPDVALRRATRRRPR
ncbi:DUF58 domain-containing protein [Isoptericola sp. b441]|uniref:DUF58 domain-containing protein n=1 Tax=Actinotalea lenta TaxID=3064654 RepID=A0ABT9D7Z3_9CELL|nr:MULTISPECIES: DUF58 domain-containing protein [unclassified Isoptericola]MDO8106238.1 DUF58 domain-containing protein [Isoptericola sp. b441]MDO8122042.1 DUF58 domain-containing protein [Isoptericola sp. b490]